MRLQILLLAALVVAGCAAPPSSSDAQRAIRDAASSVPIRTGQDALLAATVKTKLAAIDLDSAAAVRVEVHSGAITLHGKVRTAAAKAALVTAARETSGVSSVDDRLRIDPKARGAREGAGDFGLAAAVTTALTGQIGVNALKVRVSAIDGVVTLTGTVSSASLKTTALETARGASGVKSVVDRITVGT